METYWGALGTVIAIYVLLRAERSELRGEIRTLDEKFDRKFDGLTEMLAASGTLNRPPQPPAA